jgi:hypothetical protein
MVSGSEEEENRGVAGWHVRSRIGSTSIQIKQCLSYTQNVEKEKVSASAHQPDGEHTSYDTRQGRSCARHPASSSYCAKSLPESRESSGLRHTVLSPEFLALRGGRTITLLGCNGQEMRNLGFHLGPC